MLSMVLLLFESIFIEATRKVMAQVLEEIETRGLSGKAVHPWKLVLSLNERLGKVTVRVHQCIVDLVCLAHQQATRASQSTVRLVISVVRVVQYLAQRQIVEMQITCLVLPQPLIVLVDLLLQNRAKLGKDAFTGNGIEQDVGAFSLEQTISQVDLQGVGRVAAAVHLVRRRFFLRGTWTFRFVLARDEFLGRVILGTRVRDQLTTFVLESPVTINLHVLEGRASILGSEQRRVE